MKQNEKIKLFLAKPNKELDYWEGLELYKAHPDAKPKNINNFEKSSQMRIMAQKLIYELERLVGANYSNRFAVFNNPKQALYNLDAKQPQLENYSYKIAYDDLPESFQALVVEKGKLYTSLEVLKKELVRIGTKNDAESQANRKSKIKQMHEASDRIKEIHAILVRFESPQMEEAEDEESEEASEETSEQKTEFEFTPENKYALKAELSQLRSNVIRQEKRAQDVKNEQKRIENEAKAKAGRERIAAIEEYLKSLADAD